MVNVPDFDTLYRADPDPWDVASSFYEQRKRAVLLAWCDPPSYRVGVDPDCGTVELAAEPVTRTDTGVATDSSVEAVPAAPRAASANARATPSDRSHRILVPSWRHSMTPEPLSRLTPIPAAWALPAGYLRHEADPEDLRRGIDQVVGRADWATLDWSALVEALLRVGVTDIPLGRLVEGHVDALRILAQAGCEPRPDRQYGVWASRSAGTGLAAVAGPEGLRLNGTVRFASGAGVIDRALVPVWLDESTHLLVDLATDGLPVDRSQWRTSAMMVSQSHTVTVDDVAVPRSDVVGDRELLPAASRVPARRGRGRRGLGRRSGPGAGHHGGDARRASGLTRPGHPTRPSPPPADLGPDRGALGRMSAGPDGHAAGWTTRPRVGSMRRPIGPRSRRSALSPGPWSRPPWWRRCQRYARSRGRPDSHSIRISVTPSTTSDCTSPSSTSTPRRPGWAGRRGRGPPREAGRPRDGHPGPREAASIAGGLGGLLADLATVGSTTTA